MTSEPPPATERAPLRRRPLLWVITVAALLVVALGASAAWAFVNSRDSVDASTGTTESSAPTPTEAETSAPPIPSTEPTAAQPLIPAECVEIYTKDWTLEMDGLVLNPGWASDPHNVQYGSHDVGLVTMLEATKALTCKWGHPGGGSDRGIITNIAALTPEQQASTLAHIQANGYTCYEELGGTRCVIEAEPSDDGQSGESHFFRDGIWAATLWMNIQPDGYTHDIVTALFDS